MGNKAQKCCCCPECTAAPGRCCQCIPTTICVTLTPEYEDPCSVELDWDASSRSFLGALVCNGTTYDLLFFFDKDDGCKFKLRSVALGFPEDYEMSWAIPYDIGCGDLKAEVETSEGLLEFEAPEKYAPTGCRGCKCLCECICVDAIIFGRGRYVGKLCWQDYNSDEWCGTLTDVVNPYDQIEACVRMRRRGEMCDPEIEEDCDPYDDTCVMVLSIPDAGIEEWVDLEECEHRSIAHTFELYEGTISLFCAHCNQDCTPDFGCFPCDPDEMPETLTVTVTGMFGCDGQVPPTIDFEVEVTRGEDAGGLMIYCGETTVDVGTPELEVDIRVMVDLFDCEVVFGWNFCGREGVGVGRLLLKTLSCDPVDMTTEWPPDIEDETLNLVGDCFTADLVTVTE